MQTNTNKKTHQFLAEAAADNLQLPLRGDCMTPCLNNDSIIDILSADFYWPGDILVYRDRNDRLLAHRLLGYYRRDGEWKCLIQADNAQGPDMGAYPSQIIGKVVSEKPSVRQRLMAIRRYTAHGLRSCINKLPGDSRKKHQND